MTGLYHEIAHIAFDSFQPVNEKDKIAVLKKALAAAGEEDDESTRAGKIARRIDVAPKMVTSSYIGLASLISPHLPNLVNCMEDWRVNAAMGDARPGTIAAFEARAKRIFERGILLPDGGRSDWIDLPENSQVTVGLMLALAGYDSYLVLADDVVECLQSDEIDALVTRVRANARSAASIYGYAVEALEILRKFGFCLHEDDPNDDEPEPQPEKAADDAEPGEKPESDPDSSADESEPSEGGEPGDQDDEPGDSEGTKSDDGADGESSSTDDDANKDSTGSSDSEDDGDEDSDDTSGDSDGDDGDKFDNDAEADDSRTKGGGEPGEEPDDADQDDASDNDESGETADPSSDAADAGDGDLGEPAEPDYDDTDPSDDSADVEDDSGDGERSEAGDPSGMSGVGGEEGAATEPDAAPSEPDPNLQRGDADQAAAALAHFLGHDRPHMIVTDEDDEPMPENMDPSTPIEMNGDEEGVAELTRAVSQGEHFDRPSSEITQVVVFESRKWDTESYFNTYDPSVQEAPESVLGPGLLRMRVAFADNSKSKKVTNLKSGKVNGRTLGRRAAVGDERLFHKRDLPGKKDYFVVVGLDISGSTASGAIHTIKAAAYAQAQLLHRAGIDFAVYAHTGDYSTTGVGIDLVIHEIKGPEDAWDVAAQRRLGQLLPTAANLDGHTLEFYRKVCDRSRATEKVILYYTDGAMPAENYQEELEILLAEIQLCTRKGYTLMAVGVGNEEPIQYGFDTARLDTLDDIPNVVRHLERRLSGR